VTYERAGPQELVARRETSDLGVPQQRAVGHVPSSALILGHDPYPDASALTEILLDEGVDAAIARCTDDVQSMNARCHRDLVIVDGDMVAIDHLAALLTTVRARSPESPLLLLTSWPACDSRIRPALGVVEGWYLLKPINIADLVLTVHMVAVRRRAGDHNPLQRAASRIA
jgi:DNA-binding response OmpR family regulator